MENNLEPTPVEWLVSKIFGDAKHQEQWEDEIENAKSLQRYYTSMKAIDFASWLTKEENHMGLLILYKEFEKEIVKEKSNANGNYNNK